MNGILNWRKRGLSPFLLRFWPFLLLGILAFALAGVKEAYAAVANDAASESHTGTAGNASSASFTWTHTPVGTPRGALVFVYTISATKTVTSVTYGGVAMTEVPGGAAVDTAGEPGRVDTFFLGASIPTGAQSVVVNRTNNTVVMYATVATQTAAANTEVTGIILLQADQVLAEQSVTDGSPGSNSVRYAGAYSGLPAPPTVGANSTLLHNIDLGAFGASTVRETTAGQGARLVGFAAATDDVAAVHLAVRERVTTIATGSDPVATTIAPGAAATDVDLFTLQTSSGTETITSVTVNLSTNSGVGRLAITDNAGTELGFTTTPVTGSNTITVTGMSATTTLTTFKVRITPLSHAAMPAPPGAAYAITAPVTAWAGSNRPAGSDTNPNALTIDNLSPASATAVSGSADNARVTLNWTTSAATDFSRSVMLRWTGGTAGAQVPAEGTDYVNDNTIGTATVVCVRTADAAAIAVSGVDGAGTGGCSATALTNNQAYTYRIFQKDLNGNYDTGVAVGSFTPAGSYNATDTAANAITGVIKTKIAGISFNLDLIALNSARTATIPFIGTVKVELLNSSSGGTLDANGCNANWPNIQTLATNPVFVAADNGRKSVSFQENNAWRDVRVRISYPATETATAIGCSINNFAIRPNSLSFSVTDGDWETAGTTRALNNTSTASGTTVHKAGRPFTITATAYNGESTPAITTNYAGTPTASITTHLIPTSCLNGTACTLNGGTFTDGTASDGIVSSVTASYAEVGAFNMQLTDTSFADVDAADSSTAERYISSVAVAAGRFVPNHFVLASGSRTPACTTGGAVLSYMSQPFTLAATLVAENFAGGKTENYHPSSGGYAPAVVIWQAENANSGTNLTARLVNVGAAVAWSNGSYVINSTTATFNRAAAPDGPYDSLQLGTQISDPDGPVISGRNMNAATSGACTTTTCTARTVGAPSSVRFGRLKLANAYGSELLNLQIPIQTQYWSGASFVTNTADSCTTLVAGNVKLEAAPAGVAATVGGVFSSGVGSLTLSKPSTATSSNIRVCVDLGADPVGGTVCSATASANLPYLQGLWSPGTSYNNDPEARATFGVYKGNNNFIYQREAY